MTRTWTTRRRAHGAPRKAAEHRKNEDDWRAIHAETKAIYDSFPGDFMKDFMSLEEFMALPRKWRQEYLDMCDDHVTGYAEAGL